ncbi:hypothetical protein KP509_34G058800 [Ceratopteris richardii]|uniref:Uncharacterized protein n=1 Tax=Ceratopteris richardii TaxID=49495 RepID=A0A8T2QL49_CERRI|nr:hypothetical protein KP509_34G058800 [Ceratopteris richardii]
MRWLAFVRDRTCTQTEPKKITLQKNKLCRKLGSKPDLRFFDSSRIINADNPHGKSPLLRLSLLPQGVHGTPESQRILLRTSKRSYNTISGK